MARRSGSTTDQPAAPRSQLIIKREIAYDRLSARIRLGRESLFPRGVEGFSEIYHFANLVAAVSDWRDRIKSWSDYNEEMIRAMFDGIEHLRSYKAAAGAMFGASTPADSVIQDNERLHARIKYLETLQSKLELIEEKTPATPNKESTLGLRDMSDLGNPTIFIGHGQSAQWLILKSFLTDTLHLNYDEFNREPVAGISNADRLSSMLNNSAFAFLVMTAEDEQRDGNFHARMNVIHEAGLFQGRLGFRKAIILLEDGCKEFSNIQGLGKSDFMHKTLRRRLRKFAEFWCVKVFLPIKSSSNCQS